MRCALLLLIVGVGACSARQPLATIPYTEDFSSGRLGPEWSSASGGWRIVDGRLFNDGAHNVPLWLSAALPADVRVSVDAESKSDAVDLKLEVFGDGAHHSSGYVVILAGWNNSKSIIARLDEHGPEQTPDVLKKLMLTGRLFPEKYVDRREIVARYERRSPNTVYHMQFERRGNDVTFSVDGAPLLHYFDPSPLAGPGHDRFAFNNWASAVYFDNLRIEPPP